MQRRTGALPAGLALGAAAVLHAGVAAGGAPVQDSPAGGVRAVMKTLSEHFRALEAGLAEDDAERARSAAGGLAQTAAQLQRAPLPSERRRPEMLGLAERLVVVSNEIEELSSLERLTGARQALAELRETCVTCHARHRDDNETRGAWPAQRATVEGTVRLLDVEGGVYGDASWVLLFLERAGAAPEPYRADRLPARVHQRGRAFEPRVLPVVVGTTVDFPNDDTIFHNVFSLSKAAPFDLGVYEPGRSRSVPMERTGLVKVYCNIHPDMAASIVVLREPWFALTNPRGHFLITGIPAGRWTLRAWNDRGVEGARELELADGEWRALELELQETRRVLPHKNKFGKPYPEKY